MMLELYFPVPTSYPYLWDWSSSGCVVGCDPGVPPTCQPGSVVPLHPEIPPFVLIPPGWVLLLASRLENSLELGYILLCSSPGEAHFLLALNSIFSGTPLSFVNVV